MLLTGLSGPYAILSFSLSLLQWLLAPLRPELPSLPCWLWATGILQGGMKHTSRERFRLMVCVFLGSN